jgi:hypothetical protein
MNINVLTCVENEDGTADLELKLDQEALSYFINVGINSVLRQVITELQDEI